MILTTSATHALRAMASLAGAGSGRAVLGRDLASRIGLPGHYLAKVLATLTRSGLLTASRGAKGGYRLARPADHIPLVAVVLPFEGARGMPACLLRPQRPCGGPQACGARAAWDGVTRAYASFFRETTVADIQAGNCGLERDDAGRGRFRAIGAQRAVRGTRVRGRP